MFDPALDLDRTEVYVRSAFGADECVGSGIVEVFYGLTTDEGVFIVAIGEFTTEAVAHAVSKDVNDAVAVGCVAVRAGDTVYCVAFNIFSGK